MSSPTQRALAEARARGWPAQVVEKWNAHARIRIDLFGCIDILALDDRHGVLGIQACSGTNHAARAEKIRDLLCGSGTKSDAVRRFLEHGNRLEVWSFSKKGPRGKRKLWELRVEPITTETPTHERREEEASTPQS